MYHSQPACQIGYVPRARQVFEFMRLSSHSWVQSAVNSVEVSAGWTHPVQEFDICTHHFSCRDRRLFSAIQWILKIRSFLMLSRLWPDWILGGPQLLSHLLPRSFR